MSDKPPKEVNELDLSGMEMPTEAATDEAMGVLHGAVAKVLTVAVTQMPTPQYIGAAIAFLKNNSITSNPAKNRDLAALNAALAEKRKRGELRKPALDEAAAEFERMQGQNGMMQ
jgi:hypothetical protein